MRLQARKAYINFDPRDTSAYSVAEAARYLRLPAATLRSWVAGRPYPKSNGIVVSKPLIRPAQSQPPLLSFWNLVEAHVLKALRTDHAVSLGDLRKAIRYAEKELGIDRLLLDNQLKTVAGKLFLERYGKLINLSASGQLAMRRMFEEHLQRIDWGDLRYPVRLFPFVSSAIKGSGRPIVIDPQVAFGRPIIARNGVSTLAIADRVDAGESPEDLARDYGLEIDEIEQAVVYERAA